MGHECTERKWGYCLGDPSEAVEWGWACASSRVPNSENYYKKLKRLLGDSGLD